MAMIRPESYEQQTGLYMLEPYDPDRIPVIFVHGLLSIPQRFPPERGTKNRRSADGPEQKAGRSLASTRSKLGVGQPITSLPAVGNWLN
jgi:hypothetical protein